MSYLIEDPPQKLYTQTNMQSGYIYYVYVSALIYNG